MGSNVYLIRAYSIGAPATNIVAVDTAKQMARDLFAKPLNRARDFVALDGGKTLAVSIQGDDALRYIDAANGNVTGEVKIEGGPNSLAVLGQCVLVGRRRQKRSGGGPTQCRRQSGGGQPNRLLRHWRTVPWSA